MKAALEIDIEPIAQAIAKRAMEIIAEQKFNPPPDPLLTVRETAVELRLGETTIYDLVKDGFLTRALGIKAIRIRQSVVDAYGKPSSK